MQMWRRWVMPILFVIIGAAIAASLTKLAFFPDAQFSTEQPFAEIADPVTSVERGSIVNELTLSGTIARDSAYPVRSEINGTITHVHVSQGQSVSAGQVLVTVKQDFPSRVFEIAAPEAGDLAEFTLVKGQTVSTGGEVASLEPARYHVLSTVEPVQLYRLLDAPSEASVTITGGPAPFDCTGLRTQVSDGGTTSVRCAVPTDQVVFPGLPAILTIAVGSVDDALLIPTTAVKGGAGSGIVWVDKGDGSEPETRDVVLGVSDGSMVEVIEGLTEGELIRQFVPGAAAPVEEFCYEIAPGQEFCETGVSW